jgi:predicted DNA-binding transcriptional regulator YafY
VSTGCRTWRPETGEAGEDDLIVEVLFDPSVAWWAVPRLTSRADVEQNPDGGATAHFPVASVDAFIGWLIGLEDQAEVLGPPEVRKRFIGHVSGAA